MAERSNLINFVDGLRREAQTVRNDFEKDWDRNLRRYCGDHWDKKAPQGLRQLTINLTQNAIIAKAAIQLEQTPTIKLEPRETNDVPIVFASTSFAGKAGAAAVELGGSPLTREQIAGDEPIPMELVQVLLSLTTAQEIESTTEQGVLSGEGGDTPTETTDSVVVDVPIFTEDDFIFVNDSLAAESLQKVLQIIWQNDESDFHWIENVLNKTVVGHWPMLGQWDDEKRMPVWENVPAHNVWIDPVATSLKNAEYVIFDEIMSQNEAISRFPDHEQAIREASDQGIQSGERSNYADVYRSVSFERKMVVLRTCWQRYIQFPESPQDLLERGEVSIATDVAFDDTPDGLVSRQVQKQLDGLPVYTDAQGGEMVPGGEGWPTRTGIRQIQILADRIVVDDSESPFVDIPMAWNVNIPVPGKPYGLGDPYRLEDLQQAINRVTSIIHDWVRMNPHPVIAMPQSVKNALGQNSNNIHNFPGKVIGVPDSDWQSYGGKAMEVVHPPTLPKSLVDLLQMLISQHDRLSGHSQVLQGSSVPGVESGRAIEALQSAARGALGFTSHATERAIRHSVKVTLGMIRDFFSEEDWSQYVSSYPVQVLKAIVAKARAIDYDIKVEVVSGKGEIRRAEQEKALTLRQLGAISIPTLLERMGIPDPEQEAQRAIAEQQPVQ